MNITAEQHETINEMAYTRAALEVLSDYSDDELTAWVAGELSNEEFFESEDTLLWQPFEYYDPDAAAEVIANLANSFYQFAKQIAELLQPATTTN